MGASTWKLNVEVFPFLGPTAQKGMGSEVAAFLSFVMTFRTQGEFNTERWEVVVTRATRVLLAAQVPTLLFPSDSSQHLKTCVYSTVIRCPGEISLRQYFKSKVTCFFFFFLLHIFATTIFHSAM